MEEHAEIAKYVAGLYDRFPDITAYALDDWDWTWADEGYQFLEACDFGMAELTFQRLIAARPQDAEGYEGLAMVYHAIGLKQWAVRMIDEAVRLARAQIRAERMDVEVLSELQEEQARIHAMPAQPPGPAADAVNLPEEE